MEFVGRRWKTNKSDRNVKTDAVSVPYPLTPGPPYTVPESEPVGPVIAHRHDGGYALRELLSVPCLFLHRSTVFHADPGGSPLRLGSTSLLLQSHQFN